MSEQPTDEMIGKWHRWFAIECNNRAWELSSRDQRTECEEQEMLNAAYAAAFHWSKVGTPLHGARADLALASAHSLLKHGDLALHYARRCIDFFKNNPCEDWDLAFAHAAMATAAAVAGDAALHQAHYSAAKDCGDAICDEEDRRAFEDEFVRVPKTVERA